MGKSILVGILLDLLVLLGLYLLGHLVHKNLFRDRDGSVKFVIFYLILKWLEGGGLIIRIHVKLSLNSSEPLLILDAEEVNALFHFSQFVSGKALDSGVNILVVTAIGLNLGLILADVDKINVLLLKTVRRLLEGLHNLLFYTFHA